MRERHRSILRSTVVLALSALAIGCGPSSSDDATASQDLNPRKALSSCTALIDGTNGQACSKEGMACDFVFACESFTQLARCSCADGRFACTDSSGNVAPGSSPQCVKNAPPSTEECPATMEGAIGIACDTLGRSCFYEGALCAERPLPIRHLDYCQCARDPSGSMAYVCRKTLCDPLLED